MKLFDNCLFSGLSSLKILKIKDCMVTLILSIIVTTEIELKS